MLRDYELLKHNYADLLSKQLQSQLAMSMRSQEGQQFRLVDPPSLPTMPSSPKRVKISLGGLAGGVLVGLALAFFVETTNKTFHTEKEMRQGIKVPIMLTVPLMLVSSEGRARNWKGALEWLAGSALVLAVTAA